MGTADAQLASAKAAAVRAEADLQKAQIDFSRAETLRKADAVPQQQLDTARLALDGARASKAQADAQVALAMDGRVSAQSRVGEARGRVDQSAPVAPQIAAAHAGAALAEARVRSAQAALALAKLQVGYTRIVAPADGWASKLSVHEGQLVAVGQPLVELVPSETYLVASFKETQIGKMRPGQPAEIAVDAFPGRTLTGKIESLAGGTGASFSLLPPDNSTGNFVKVVQRVPIRISLVDPPADLVLRPASPPTSPSTRDSARNPVGARAAVPRSRHARLPGPSIERGALLKFPDQRADLSFTRTARPRGSQVGELGETVR